MQGQGGLISGEDLGKGHPAPGQAPVGHKGHQGRGGPLPPVGRQHFQHAHAALVVHADEPQQLPFPEGPVHHPGVDAPPDVLPVGEGVVVLQNHRKVRLAQLPDLHLPLQGQRGGDQVGRLGAGLQVRQAVTVPQELPGLPAVGGGDGHGLHPGAQGLRLCPGVRRQHVGSARGVVQKEPFPALGHNLCHPPVKGPQHVHIQHRVPLHKLQGFFFRSHGLPPTANPAAPAGPGLRPGPRI